MNAADRFRELCIEEMDALASGDLLRWSTVHHARQDALQDLMVAGASMAELQAAFQANRRLLAATRSAPDQGVYRRAA